MHPFCNLHWQLSQARSANLRQQLVHEFFRKADVEDACWAVYLLSPAAKPFRKKIKQLEDYFLPHCQLPVWVIDECRAQNSDPLENLAYLYPQDTLVGYRLAKAIASMTDWSNHSAPSATDTWWSTISPYDRYLWWQFLYRGFRQVLSLQELATILQYQCSFSVSQIQWCLHQPISVANFATIVAKVTEQAHEQWLHNLLEQLPQLDDDFTLGQFPNIDKHVVAEDFPAEYYTFLNVQPALPVQLAIAESTVALWSSSGALLNHLQPKIVEQARKLLPLGTRLWGELSNTKNNSGHFHGYDVTEWAGKSLVDLLFADRWERLNAELAGQIMPNMDRVHLCQRLLPKDTVRQLFLDQGLLSILAIPLEAKGSEQKWIWLSPPEIRLVVVLLYAVKIAGQWQSYTFGVRDGTEFVSIASVNSHELSAEMKTQFTEFIRTQRLERSGRIATVPPKFIVEIEAKQIVSSARSPAGIRVRETRIMQVIAEEKLTGISLLDELYLQSGIPRQNT
ncbi:MAG: hypothetical protein R3B84_14620 [Zavarzinella sp.]